jgi:hypothetical protein
MDLKEISSRLQRTVKALASKETQKEWIFGLEKMKLEMEEGGIRDTATKTGVSVRDAVE